MFEFGFVSGAGVLIDFSNGLKQRESRVEIKIINKCDSTCHVRIQFGTNSSECYIINPGQFYAISFESSIFDESTQIFALVRTQQREFKFPIYNQGVSKRSNQYEIRSDGIFLNI